MRKPDNWIISLKEQEKSKRLLFSFPYAGGNSAIFHSWKRLFPLELTVVPIEFPGKGRRFKENPYTTLEDAVKELRNWFLKELYSDFVLFGHSLGALIAFELARSLEESGVSPKLLVVSGCNAPSFKPAGNERQTFNNLSDQELIGALKRLNGTPAEILENKDLMKVLLPVIRSDFCLLDHYTFSFSSFGKRLDCPLLILGGMDDGEVPIDGLNEWGSYTEREFKVKLFEGDHFFLHKSGHLIATEIMLYLSELDK